MSDNMELVQAHTPFPGTVMPVDPENNTGGMGFWVGGLMGVPSKGLPTYWSPNRDAWLRDFVVMSDPLKIATATFMNKAVSVPVTVRPVDATIKRHNALAAELEWNLINNSGFMRGFKDEFKRFCFDYLTADNGAFMLVLGRGDATGPITGKATGMVHLDSVRCQRTGDPIYPVIYMHVDGKRYALHYTRVIMMANMPSPRAEMFGVGLSAASCAIESSQELKDIATYSAEKMGSRPPRQILYVKTGAVLDQLKSAIGIFEHKLSSDDFQRFAKTLLLAPKSANQTLDLGTIDLASVPDGFDREKVTVLDLSMLAAAYGLDLHDLSVSLGVGGQTRSTAEIQAKKGRGKGVHEFLETFADQARRRFLPDSLTIGFDVVDDDADEQRARSRDVRSQYRERDLRSGVTAVRTERVNMLRTGDLTPEDFNELELADGRTPEGLDIMFLFHSNDTDMVEWLGDLGAVADQTAIQKMSDEEREETIESIIARKVLVYQDIERASTARVANRAKMALAALQKLQMIYQEAPTMDTEMTDTVAMEAMDSQRDQPADGDDPTESEPADESPPEDADEMDDEMDDDEEAARKQLPFGETARSLAEATDLVVDDQLLIDEASTIYEIHFQALLEQAVSGEMRRERFMRAMDDLVASTLLFMFLRGSRLQVGRMNAAPEKAITEYINTNRTALANFSADIYDGRYAQDRLTLGGALKRSEMWVNMAVGSFFLGNTYRADNPRYKWVRNIFKDSCRTCVRLDGQVHTSEGWRASGWRPRSEALECHGFNCGCSFVETTEPEKGSY